jgi:dihydrofolate reductase
MLRGLSPKKGSHPEANPAVAEWMTSMPKFVFSRTLRKASWKNTKILKGDIAAEVRKMKQESGPDMVILGSGSVVSQLTVARLIDEYQIVLNPIVLGSGRTMFAGVEEKVHFALKRTRTFNNGNIVLWYEPAPEG